MAETNTPKPAKTPDAKPIVDVAQPGKTPPSAISKSIIVTHGPTLKDPMVKDTPRPESPSQPAVAPSEATKPAKLKLQPLESSPAPESENPEAKPDTTAAEASPSSTAEPAANATTTDKSDNPASPDDIKDPAETSDAEAAELAEHEAAIQKLIDSKQYFLPINTIENRRSKRFVALGVLLSLLLIVAWGDIALDAGLVAAGNIPHTHLFDQQTAAPQPIAVAPPKLPALNLTYTSKTDGVSFKYNKAWKLSAFVGTSGPEALLGKASSDDTTNTVISLYEQAPQPSNLSITIKYVHYRPVNLAGKHAYLRQLIYTSELNGSQVYFAQADLASAKGTEKVNQTTKNADVGLQASNGTAVMFGIGSTGDSTNSSSTYTSLSQAKAYFNSDSYAEAQAILLSLKP